MTLTHLFTHIHKHKSSRKQHVAERMESSSSTLILLQLSWWDDWLPDWLQVPTAQWGGRIPGWGLRSSSTIHTIIHSSWRMKQSYTLILNNFSLTGGNMFYSQSSFPWCPLQWCSWKTENIQVGHEADHQLIVRQALGRQAEGSLLQLQGTLSWLLSLYSSSVSIKMYNNVWVCQVSACFIDYLSFCQVKAWLLHVMMTQ